MAEPVEGEGGLLTAGGFSAKGESPTSSATGLQYQHLNVDFQPAGFLHGGTLGRGQRVAPSASAHFSQSLSGGQFGGGHAKSTMAESEEEEAEE